MVGVRAGYLRWPLCIVGCRPDGEGCMGLTFYLEYFFPVKPQVCNAVMLMPTAQILILFYMKSCLSSM